MTGDNPPEMATKFLGSYQPSMELMGLVVYRLLPVRCLMAQVMMPRDRGHRRYLASLRGPFLKTNLAERLLSIVIIDQSFINLIWA